MSLPSLAAELTRFLISEEPEIICIKGRWGVGKTYAWRHFLMKAQQEGRIKYDKYSYVSLFGRNSLTDLRNSITENTVSTIDVEAKPSPTSFDKAITMLRQGFQKSGFLASLAPQSNGYAQLAQRALYLFVRNTIVCLDDLERAGNGLDMKDVLGLASQLKDEKGCKVVILLNDEKLAGDAKVIFQSQLEKVADFIIDFEIDPEEAAVIALNSKEKFYNNLKNNCIKLKIDNIRVIKKAEQFCARLEPLLLSFDERVLQQVVHTVTLACYAKYQPDKAPSFEFIRSFSPWDATIRTVNNDKSEVNPHYIVVSEYGLTSIDGLDEVILTAVEKGFCDEGQLQCEAKLINDNLRVGDMKADYDRAWELYRSSFAMNEDEFIDALVKAVQRNRSIISPPNLSNAVEVLRELGSGEKASELIKSFIKSKHDQGPQYWDHNNFEYRGQIRDGEIIAAMSERRMSFRTTTTPLHHIRKIAEHNGWNNEDESVILQLSDEEIAKMLMTSKKEEFNVIVSCYRLFLSIGNPSPQVAEICYNCRSALSKVACSSKLNAMRVKSLFPDVDLDK